MLTRGSGQLGWLCFPILDSSSFSLVPFENKFMVSFLQDLQSGNLASSRRNSFSSTASDNDRPRYRGVEPPYSFAGMHCIFDQSKASGNSC